MLGSEMEEGALNLLHLLTTLIYGYLLTRALIFLQFSPLRTEDELSSELDRVGVVGWNLLSTG
jgi:hypothetical protein